jgi:hypothetical protein
MSSKEVELNLMKPMFSFSVSRKSQGKFEIKRRSVQKWGKTLEFSYCSEKSTSQKFGKIYSFCDSVIDIQFVPKSFLCVLDISVRRGRPV